MRKQTKETYTYRGLTVVLTRKQIKNIIIKVSEDGSYIKASSPYMTSKMMVNRLIDNNYQWILENMRKNNEANDSHSVILFGRTYDVVPISLKDSKFIVSDSTIYVYCPPSTTNRQEYARKKVDSYAREKLKEKVAFYERKWGDYLGRHARKITIRHMTSRYGSMNAQTASMNISTILTQKTDEQIEYVVVHELCHLFYQDHSRNFHALTEKCLPNAKKIRRELKTT